MKHKLEQLQVIFDDAIVLIASRFDRDQAYGALLELRGTGLGCEGGTFWKIASACQQLCPVAVWNPHQIKTPKLERDTRFRRLTMSEGNAGHVWRSQKPIWTVDLLRDMCIPRSVAAVYAGLRGGIWFAIKTEHDVYGVIELLGGNISLPDAELLAGIEILGIRLGRAIATQE